jgi:hypothetical protein
MQDTVVHYMASFKPGYNFDETHNILEPVQNVVANHY